MTGSVLSRAAISSGRPDSPEHDAGRLDGVGEDLVVARQRAQLGPGFLVEIAEGVGRNGRVETVGLREHRVERDHDRAEPGQFGDEVAIRVRGHGHCPSFSGLLSSISTMVTGRAVFLRGSMRWNASNVLTRISSTGAGSAMRSAANPINSARHSRRAYPMRRLNHLGNARSRFMDYYCSPNWPRQASQKVTLASWS